ncbi:hypothetical protein [Streptomyces goshikiensis]
MADRKDGQAGGDGAPGADGTPGHDGAVKFAWTPANTCRPAA